MSADTKGKKRKSGDNVVPTAKKIKTTTEANVAKSADRPAPVKSALKKSKTVVTEIANGKTTKTTKKVIEQTAADSEEADTLISDTEESGAHLTADQTAALLAGFTDSEEDSEDEAPAASDEGIALSKLPAPPSTKESTTSDPDSTPGSIYISRLPHGFHEPQLHAYLSQFGTITPGHLRLARSKKTGKPQHHAFIEFASASVADIVAKTMDKYLLFGHILQVRRVPQEQVTEGMWKKPKGLKRGGKAKPRNRIEGRRLRGGSERGVWEGRVRRERERREGKERKLKQMGYGYEFEMVGVKGVDDVVVKRKGEGVMVRGEGAEEKGAEGGAESGEGGEVLEGEKQKKKKKKGSKKEVEKVVEAVEDIPLVTGETTVKRKNKSTGTTTSTTTKKRKVKAAA